MKFKAEGVEFQGDCCDWRL